MTSPRPRDIMIIREMALPFRGGFSNRRRLNEAENKKDININNNE
jgi:hypothetical protein